MHLHRLIIYQAEKQFVSSHNPLSLQELFITLLITPKNVSNSDFRSRLIQMAWDKADYGEVIRLTQDGVERDAGYAGLVNDWYKWQYRVYREIGDKDNELQLARHFFFKRDRFGEKEFS